MNFLAKNQKQNIKLKPKILKNRRTNLEQVLVKLDASLQHGCEELSVIESVVRIRIDIFQNTLDLSTFEMKFLLQDLSKALETDFADLFFVYPQEDFSQSFTVASVKMPRQPVLTINFENLIIIGKMQKCERIKQNIVKT